MLLCFGFWFRDGEEVGGRAERWGWRRGWDMGYAVIFLFLFYFCLFSFTLFKFDFNIHTVTNY